jgi:hypothetical protein
MLKENIDLKKQLQQKDDELQRLQDELDATNLTLQSRLPQRPVLGPISPETRIVINKIKEYIVGRRMKKNRTQEKLLALLTDIKSEVNKQYGADLKYTRFIKVPFEANIDTVIKEMKGVSTDKDAKIIYKNYYDTLDKQLGAGKRTTSKKEIFKVLANQPTIQKSSNKNIETEILNILNS